MSRLGVLAAAVGVVCATGPAGAQGLPPADCVRELRAARIRAENGAVAAARLRAETATGLAGCELPAMTELLRLLRLEPVDARAATAVRERLAPRLANPALPLPPGLLSLMVALSGSGTEDELLLAALDGRDAAIEAAAERRPRREMVELLAARFALERRLGRLPAARATLDRLIDLEEFGLWSWRALELDFELQRWPSLAASLERMLQVPGAPESLRELYVTTLARLGRFDEMSAQLDRLAAGAAADENATARYLNLLIETGWALRDAGRDAEAEALFRRALALDPSSASARQVLLHLYGSAEERAAHETAVAERRALEEDPQALFEEGSQLLAAGDPATARDLLARAAPGLEGTRFAEAAWYNLGLAAFKLEQWPAAAEAFGEAVRLHPTRADAQFQLGYALHRADRCAEAIAPLEAALELAPGRNETHYFLAACHSALGDAAAAARESELYRRGKPGG